MATQTTTQVIKHEVPDQTGSNKVFHDENLRNLIASCDAPNDPYPVISIIGAQSGGKSTLMNKIFNLKFDEMNAEEGRRQCTKGIWVGICNSPRAVVMDIEGTDGVEAQDDLGFENRSALFALVVSDVIFVNMWQGNVGLVQGIPLLTNIFQERAKKVGPQGLPELHQTRIIFTVRDYDGRTPKDKLEKKLTTMVHEIWKSVPQAGDLKFDKYFKLDVEFFPHLVYREDEFVNKCVETRERIASGHYGNQRLSGLPVRDFPSDAKELWDKIVQNKSLDLPSQREMRARASCSAIMSELFQHFQSSNKEYQELVKAGKDNPREFDDKLKSIIDNILSEYDNQTQIYGSDIVDEMKKTLEKDIIHHAEPEFRSVMARFKTAMLDKTKLEIYLRSGESITEMKERASSVVCEYGAEFMSNTTGLKFYKYYQIEQDNFLERLDLHCKRLLADVELSARKSCSIIELKLFQQFQSNNKEFQELTISVRDNPREFDDRFNQILGDVLSEYDNETQFCGRDIANETKEILKTKILHHAEPEFRSVMARFKTAMLDKTEIEIQLRSGESITEMKERGSSVVCEYRAEFLSNTTGLKFYKYYQIEQDNFLERLDLHCKRLLADVELSAWKSCSIIELKLFQQFQSNNKEYRELIISVRDNPREFDDRFNQILGDVLSEYDNETQFCGRDIAIETKEILKTKILHLVEPAFRTVMLNFKTAILHKAKSDIPVRCGDKTNGIEQCANSVVSECHEEFMRKTVDENVSLRHDNARDQLGHANDMKNSFSESLCKLVSLGLNFYNDMIDQEKFRSELDSLSQTLTTDIKGKNAWKRAASILGTITVAGVAGGPAGAAAAAAYEVFQELGIVRPQPSILGAVTDLISPQNAETSDQNGASPSSPRFK